MMTSPLPKSVLRNLRAGDRVQISLSQVDEDGHSTSMTTDVRLTRVDNRPDVGEGGDFGLPWIFFENDGVSEGGSSVQDLRCGSGSAGRVVAINERSASRSAVCRNQYFIDGAGLYSIDEAISRRSGSMIAVHPVDFAVAYLASKPSLVVPYGLSKARFWTEWTRSGFLGARGGYNIWSEELTSERPGAEPDHWKQSMSFRLAGQQWWVHRPRFERWLIQNLSKIIKTKAEVRVEGIAAAKREYESYRSDEQYDAIRTENDNVLDDDFEDRFADYGD